MAKDKPEKDRVAHIEKMEDELEKLSFGSGISFESDDMTMEMKEKFLESVLAYEKGTFTPLFGLVEKGGCKLPEPEDLDDKQLTEKLWELINVLHLLGVELHSTDHLSDRELYEALWHDSLREEAMVMPNNPDFSYHIDMIGSGGDEDIQIQLKYYADDEDRERWAKEWPEDEIPEKATPPYDRDRHLPKKSLWGES